MRKPGLTSIVLLILFLTACSKKSSSLNDDGNETHVYNSSDLIAPVITIGSPTENQVFSTGSTIQVSGQVSDDLGLYRGNIRIINDANGNEWKAQAYEIHGLKTYNYTLTHTAQVSVPTDLTVVVFFEDHGYNGTTKTVKVKVNP
jgi:hypothetical protein